MRTFQKIYNLLSFTQRRSAVILLGLMIMGMVFEVLGIGLVIPIIMLFIQEEISTIYPQVDPVLAAIGSPSQVQLIIGVLLGLVVIYLIKAFYLAFLAWRQASFSFGVGADISQRLFRGYLHQPYAFYLQRNSAQLIRNVTLEVNMFVMALSQALIVATEGLVIIGISGLLVLVEPLGTLIVLLVLGVTGWAFHRVTNVGIAHRAVPRQYHDGQRIQHLQQSFSGIKDVKILGREDEFLRLYQTHNTQLAKIGQFMQALQALPRLWLELLAVGGLAVLVIVMLVQGRGMEAIVPILGLFATAAFRLMPSVNRILSAVQSLNFNLPVVNTLHEETELTRIDDNVANGSLVFKQAIELSKVEFTYPGAAGVALACVSIEIEKGETVGIIGPSGSGKSTLVDMVLGLLKPVAGQVNVDGRNIQSCLRAWQTHIGYVPQSIYLTDDSLRRNIAFGIPDHQIDINELKRAIKAAQLEDFLETLPQGLNTHVGERGVRLSGGQLQRIGIARALYQNPDVLVLDEATSALDMATERDVMRAVNALHGSKTIIIVAHRLSTVENCDRIIKLENGKIVQQGPPEKIFIPNSSDKIVLAHSNLV